MGLKSVIRLGTVLVILNGPAWAGNDGFIASVKQQLQDQGYMVTKVSKTFLGRVRFIATREELEREIVINPKTGEVLRDLHRTTKGVQVVVPTGITAVQEPATANEAAEEDGDSDEDDGGDDEGDDDGDDSDDDGDDSGDDGDDGGDDGDDSGDDGDDGGDDSDDGGDDGGDDSDDGDSK